MPSMTSAHRRANPRYPPISELKQTSLDTYYVVISSPEGEAAAKKDVVAAPSREKKRKLLNSLSVLA